MRWESKRRNRTILGFVFIVMERKVKQVLFPVVYFAFLLSLLTPPNEEHNVITPPVHARLCYWRVVEINSTSLSPGWC